MDERIINLGIGFVTGRKNFRKVLKTYVYRWKQTSSSIRNRVKLHLFVNYDLEYNNTQIDDYVNIRPEILDNVDSVFFISKSLVQNEIAILEGEKAAGREEAAQLFGKGYAGSRNAIIYYALKKKMDHLIFLDDDEYPVAVTKTRRLPIWSGQDIFSIHLENLEKADITNGLHCGYISPIPQITFNDTLTEYDFRLFIEAVSNDILEWEKIMLLMNSGGVTYADPQIFIDNAAEEVKELNHSKFISGSNLGINLTDIKKVLPFYNPPMARGEDTFLSTCLGGHKVLRVPCYTFHDGFGIYSDLLDGVLPLQLKHISATSEKIISRFQKACIGWIRYKPLYLYITRPESFKEEIKIIKGKIAVAVPKLCGFFNSSGFYRAISDFDKYSQLAESHYRLFRENQRVWESIREYAVQYSF